MMTILSRIGSQGKPNGSSLFFDEIQKGALLRWVRSADDRVTRPGYDAWRDPLATAEKRECDTHLVLRWPKRLEA